MRLQVLIPVIVVVLTGCQSQGDTSTPPVELTGVWETTAPEYAERFFEFRGDHLLVLGSGPLNTDIYAITQVEKTPSSESTLYEITYEDLEGQEHIFAFYHDSSPAGVITLKNQSEIKWTKRGAR